MADDDRDSPPQSADDPRSIAARYAAEVNAMIDDAAKVATDAFGKINQEPDSTYGTRDAIQSFFDLTRIAVRGAADVARIPLQTRPDPRVMMLADHVSTVVRRGLLEANEVAADAAARVDQDPKDVDRNALVQSAVKIARIGMLRTAEIAQTIAAGPGAYGDPVLKSDPVPIAPKPYDRALVVAGVVARKDVPGEDVAKRIGFDLPNGVLPAHAESFVLTANSAGLSSGVYSGRVEAHALDTGQVDDSVPVSFAL